MMDPQDGRAAFPRQRGAGTTPQRAMDTPQDVGAYSAAPEPSELGWLMRWSGAVLSLALVAGLGVWGWQLTLRDVSGVPVVLALEGPMRVAPDAPGGAAIPHQGLAVNAVQEARGAAPVPDQVHVLDEPESLAADDMQTADALSAAERTAQTMALVERLVADAVAEDSASFETASRSVPTPPEPEPFTATPAILPVEGGLGRSPRPVVRPASFAPPGATPEAAPQDTVLSSVEPGTRLVQLGAFDTPAIAQAQWERLLAGEFAPLFADKARLVQQAESGGRTFYRLRAAGFDDLDDARRFCAALMSGRADCIPVIAR